MKTLQNKFNYIKKMLNNKNDIKILVDNLYYYNKKVLDLLDNVDFNYCMNSYNNFTKSDFLEDIIVFENIKEVKKHYFDEYIKDYANLYYNNFIFLLNQIAI